MKTMIEKQIAEINTKIDKQNAEINTKIDKILGLIDKSEN